MRDHILGKKNISATSRKKKRKLNTMKVKYKVRNPLKKKKKEITAEPACAYVKTLGLCPEVKLSQSSSLKYRRFLISNW